MSFDPTWLKEYVSHETLAAFCALELLGLVWMTFALLREKDKRREDMDQRLEDYKALVPLTDKLLRIISAANRRRSSSTSASPSPIPSLPTKG